MNLWRNLSRNHMPFVKYLFLTLMCLIPDVCSSCTSSHSLSLSLHLSNIISVIRSSFFQNKAGWRACLALLSGTHSAKGPPSGTSSNDFRKIVRVYIPPIFIDILMHSINVIVYLWGSSASSSEDVIFGRSKRGPSPSFMPHQVGKRGCLCLAISLKLQPL